MTTRKSFLELSREGQRKRIKKLLGNQLLPAVPLNDQDESLNEVTSSERTEALVCVEQAEFSRPTQTFNPFPDNEDKDQIFLDGIKTIDSELREWATKFNITHVAITALLSILRLHSSFSFLPSDSRTLMKTPREIVVRDVKPGHYYHIGIQFWLQKLISKSLSGITEVELMFGIDGLPLFNSNAGELWPILGSVFNIPQLVNQVFPTGLYYGMRKPINCIEFLKDFVEELSSLIKEGIILNGKKIIKLKGICCDAPAKSFILGTKGHTGYSSCTRCKQERQYINQRVTFPHIENNEPRTHEGFLTKEDKSYNLNETALTTLPGLNFVNSFPLDYMHLVCLGVMRTLMYTWVFGHPPLKLPHRFVSKISTNLLDLGKFIPSEFCRKPRSLDILKRWKATEYRQFLLYTGPTVLKDALLPDYKEYFDNFMVLHVAMRILLCSKTCYTHLESARELLVYFLKTCKIIYGQQFMTHNFHGLVHICDDIATFGPLDKCSAFKFENYLHPLKKLVRKPEKPLQHISKRLIENTNTNMCLHDCDNIFPKLLKPHSSGPLPENTDVTEQFNEIKFPFFKLQTTPPNSCCQLLDGSIITVLNIVRCTKEKNLYLVCTKFLIKKDLFGPPLCPSSAIGIFEVKDLSMKLEMRPISEVAGKMLLLRFKEKQIVYPQLHFD